MEALRRARATFDAWFDEPRDVRAVALLRIFVGPIVIYHLTPFLAEMLHGTYYADYFYAPWTSWLLPPPRAVYFVMLGACVVSALLMSVGFKTRLTTAYTAAFVTYNFFLSETFFRHNRNFIVLILLMLALVPCGRVLSWDAWRAPSPLGTKASLPSPRETKASLWPMYLMRFEVVCVYCGSSISKLLNPDWRSGLVLLTRSRWYEYRLRSSILPDFVVDIVTDPTFHSLFAKFAIATELCIAVLLVTRRFRYVGAYVAVTFHAIIEIGLSVQIFSYLAVVGLLIWATPEVRERMLVIDTSAPGGASWQRWLGRLDWLARFRHEVAQGASFDTLQLTDRDGTVYEGRSAKLRALLLCPVTFWFVAPLVAHDALKPSLDPTSARVGA